MLRQRVCAPLQPTLCSSIVRLGALIALNSAGTGVIRDTTRQGLAVSVS
jgi:hypothetical protein